MEHVGAAIRETSSRHEPAERTHASMINGEKRGYAGVVGLGLLMGLGGCLVFPNGQDPNDAICVVDYDECLELGVDERVCESIYEACEGQGEGGESGGDGDDGDDCWDEVQQCLEDNGGDEQQCQGIIDECQGGEDDGPPGDDGNSCWDEVEQCYESNPEPQACEDLAEMCLGGDDGNPDDGGDEGMDDGGNQCEEILQACADEYGEGEIPEECWWEYEQCVDPGCNDPEEPGCCPDGCCEGEQCCGPDAGCCDQEYNQCIEGGGDPQECEAQYNQCVGNPGDDGGDEGGQTELCEAIANYCYNYPGNEENCDQTMNLCQEDPYSDCFPAFYQCVGVEEGDEQGLYDVDDEIAQVCFDELASCG